MKPSRIGELTGAYDERELARVEGEARSRRRQHELRQQVGEHRSRLDERVAQLTKFVKATTDVEHGDTMATTIVLKHHESPVHGPGQVVALVIGVNRQGGHAVVGEEHEIAGYKVDFEFRFTAADGGAVAASIAEDGKDLSEEYNAEKIYAGLSLEPLVPLDEAAAEKAVSDAELAEMYFDDTWVMLDGCARDPLLNPGIATIYNERSPLPAAA